MLIFDLYGIKVYATPLPPTASEKGPGRSLAEKAAVKRLLREAFPGNPLMRIDHTGSGAPFLSLPAPDGLHAPGQSGISPSRPLPAISVSHCRSAAVIALAPAGTRIGIDCESGDRLHQLDRVAPRFLSPDQLGSWGEAPATLWAWTIKEAIYKAVDRPGLALSWIPLPLEIPLGRATADCSVEVSGIHLNILQVDASPLTPLVMVAFSSRGDGGFRSDAPQD